MLFVRWQARHFCPLFAKHLPLWRVIPAARTSPLVQSPRSFGLLDGGGNPPDLQEEAVKTVLQQAELVWRFVQFICPVWPVLRV